jgi:D-alanyl-D-alanine carboxypeptidase
MDTGLSKTEAKKKAATVVAVPGTSEHQLGLSVDIIDASLYSLERKQETLPAQRWLMENSWKYGFVLRYPEDKVDITGIIYEPWHYRYVGTEVARELYESGLTLEEYIENLTTH